MSCQKCTQTAVDNINTNGAVAVTTPPPLIAEFTRTANGSLKTYLNGKIAFPTKYSRWGQGDAPQLGDKWVVEIVGENSFPGSNNTFYIVSPVEKVPSEEEARALADKKREELRKQKWANRFRLSNGDLGLVTGEFDPNKAMFPKRSIAFTKNSHLIEDVQAQIVSEIEKQRPYGSKSYSLVSDQKYDSQESRLTGARYGSFDVAYYSDPSDGDYPINASEIEKYEAKTDFVMSLAQNNSPMDDETFLNLVKRLPTEETELHRDVLPTLKAKLKKVNVNGQVVHITYSQSSSGTISSVELAHDVSGNTVFAMEFKGGEDASGFMSHVARAKTCDHVFSQRVDRNQVPKHGLDYYKSIKLGTGFNRCEKCGAYAGYDSI